MAINLLNNQEIQCVRQKELDLKSGLQLLASPIFADNKEGQIEFNGVQIEVLNTGVSIDIMYDAEQEDINLSQNSPQMTNYEVAESLDHLFRSESYVQSLLIGIYKLISKNEAGRVVAKMTQITLMEQAVLNCLKRTKRWEVGLDGQNIVAQMR